MPRAWALRSTPGPHRTKRATSPTCSTWSRPRALELASSLGAFGTLTASSLRDPETDRAIYLFLPPGSDPRAVGALAQQVSGAMRQAAEAGVTFSAAVLRSAARRMVIRLPAGRSDTIVAAGAAAKPGLAYRQIEHAVGALGAL